MVLHVLWGDYKKKSKIFDMAEKIGDRIVLVYGGSLVKKHGVSFAVGRYAKRTGRLFRINYSSRHLVEVEFVDVVW
jgi:alcohol dehydrogenase YqhD (iron-dependent ADH family)